MYVVIMVFLIGSYIIYLLYFENMYVVSDADNQSGHNVIVLLLYVISSHLFVPTTSHNSSMNCNWSKQILILLK